MPGYADRYKSIRRQDNNYVDRSMSNMDYVQLRSLPVLENVLEESANRVNMQESIELARSLGLSGTMYNNLAALQERAELENAQKENLKAKNQSAMTQFGNMLVQIASELVLGTLAGIARIPDLGVYLFESAVEDLTGQKSDWNFVNPLADAIDSANQWVKEEYSPIHRTTDNNLAINEFGWWMEGLPSTISTLTLLAPAVGQTKLISYLGKLGTLGKITKGASRGVAKMLAKVSGRLEDASKLSGTAKAAATSRNLRAIAKLDRDVRNFTEVGLTSFFSRTGENLQEAAGTYKEIYQDRHEQLKNMTKEEKEEFFKNNPEFKGYSDEEIAKMMAHEGANNTFKHDYIFLVTDFIQFAVANRLMSKVFRNNVQDPSKRVIESNKKQLARFTGTEVSNVAAKKTFRDYLPTKAAMKDAAEVIITEGIEEGGQTIYQKHGNDVIGKYFDENHVNKSWASYLIDPQVWDSAFWGAAGGLLFNAGARGFNKAVRNIGLYRDLKRGKLTDTEYKVLSAGKDAAQQMEIRSRISAFERLKRVLDGLSKGYDVTRELGTDVTTNQTIYAVVDETEKERLANEAITEFVTELALNSADAGTFDLLQEWLTNEEFQRTVTSQIDGYDVRQALDFNKEIVQKMNDVYQEYSYQMFRVADNVTKAALKNKDLPLAYNNHTLNKLARLYTRMNIYNEGNEGRLENLLNEIYQGNTNIIDTEDIFSFEQSAVTSKYIRRSIAQLYRALKQEHTRLSEAENSSTNTISKKGIAKTRENLNKRIKQLGKIIRGMIDETSNYGQIFTQDEIRALIGEEFEPSANSTETGVLKDITMETLDEFFNTFGYSSFEGFVENDSTKDKLHRSLANAYMEKLKLKLMVPKTAEDIVDDYEEIALQSDAYTINRMNEYNKIIENYLDGATTVDDLNERFKRIVTGEEEKNDNELSEAITALMYGFSNTRRWWMWLESKRALKQAEIEAKRQAEENANNTVVNNGIPQTPQQAQNQQQLPNPAPQAAQPQPQQAAPQQESENSQETENNEETETPEEFNVGNRGTGAAIRLRNFLLSTHRKILNWDTSSTDNFKTFLEKLKNDPSAENIKAVRDKIIQYCNENTRYSDNVVNAIVDGLLDIYYTSFSNDSNTHYNQIISGLNSIARPLESDEEKNLIENILIKYTTARGRFSANDIYVGGAIQKLYFINFNDFINYILSDTTINNEQKEILIYKLYDYLLTQRQLSDKFVFINADEKIKLNPKEYINKFLEYSRLNEDNFMRVSDVTVRHITSEGLLQIMENNGYFVDFNNNRNNMHPEQEDVEHNYYKLKKMLMQSYLSGNNEHNIKLKVEYIKDTNSLVYYLEIPNGIQADKKNDGKIEYKFQEHGQPAKFEIGYQAVPSDMSTYDKTIFSFPDGVIGGYQLITGDNVSAFDYTVYKHDNGSYSMEQEDYFINLIRERGEKFKKFRKLLDRIVMNRLNAIAAGNTIQLDVTFVSDLIEQLNDIFVKEDGTFDFEMTGSFSPKTPWADINMSLINGKVKLSGQYIEELKRLINATINVLYKEESGITDVGRVINSYVVGVDSNIMEASFRNWLAKLYKNYSQSSDIKSKLDGMATTTNEKVNMELNFSNFYITDALLGRELRDMSENYNALSFDSKSEQRDTPIGKLAYMSNGTLYVENFDAIYTNYSRNPGGIGMRVGIVVGLDHNRIPIVHWYDDYNAIKNDPIADKARYELKAIINQFLSENETVENIYKALNDLFGYQGLFFGYNIQKTRTDEKGFRISIYDRTKESSLPLVSLHFNDGTDGGDRTISILDNSRIEEGGEYGYINTDDSDLSFPVEEATMDLLIDGVYNGVVYTQGAKFNFSKKAMDNREANSNRYFEVVTTKDENGIPRSKFILKLGDEEVEYNGYLDFAISHNIGKTRNYTTNVMGHVTGINVNVTTNGIWINYDRDESQDHTVVTLETPNIFIPENSVEKQYKNENEIKGLLKRLGFEDDIIDILFTKYDEFSLIPNEFNLIFEHNGSVRGDFGADGNIRIFMDPSYNIGRNTPAQKNFEKQFFRTLLHENLHKTVRNPKINLVSKLSESVGNNMELADAIIDIMQQAVNSFRAGTVSRDLLDSPTLKFLLDSFTDAEGNIDLVKFRKSQGWELNPAYDLQTDEGRKRLILRLAEEIIVETFTDKEVCTLMNEIKYTNPITGVQEEESLLRKIINALLKFFGINVKQGSGLEAQIILLTGKLQVEDNSENPLPPTSPAEGSATANQEVAEAKIEQAFGGRIVFEEEGHNYYIDEQKADITVTTSIYGTRESNTQTVNTTFGTLVDDYLRILIEKNFDESNLDESERSKYIAFTGKQLKQQITNKVGEGWKAISAKDKLYVAGYDKDGKLYGGGIDLLVIDANGKLHIFDFKVTKNIPGLLSNLSYHRQLNTYAELEEVNTGLEVEGIYLIGLSPEITNTAKVEDGKFVDPGNSKVYLNGNAIIDVDRNPTGLEFKPLTPKPINQEPSTEIIQEVDDSYMDEEIELDDDDYVNSIARPIDGYEESMSEIPDVLYTTDVNELTNYSKDTEHNPFEIQMVNSYENYMAMFPEAMKPKIANILNKGLVNIYCK